MKTFKRIPLPDHEYLIIVNLHDECNLYFKRHYSKLADTVHYTVKAEPWVLRYVQENLPTLWGLLESDNILDVLLGLGFVEVDFTSREVELYTVIV